MKTFIPTGKQPNGLVEGYTFDPSEPGPIGTTEGEVTWHRSADDLPPPIENVTPTFGPFPTIIGNIAQ